MCRFALGCGQSSAKGLLQIAENGGLNALFGQRCREFSAAFAAQFNAENSNLCKYGEVVLLEFCLVKRTASKKYPETYCW